MLIHEWCEGMHFVQGEDAASVSCQLVDEYPNGIGRDKIRLEVQQRPVVIEAVRGDLRCRDVGREINPEEHWSLEHQAFGL